MIQLPPVTSDDVERLCDWLELNALTSPDALSSADIERLLQASGVFPSAGDQRSDDSDDLDVAFPGETVQLIVETVFEAARVRKERLAEAYPFELEDDTIARSTAWEEVSAYTALLLFDLGRHYDTNDHGPSPDSAASRLFEKIVEAATYGLFGGPTCRFGWPKENGWPTAIHDRIQQMANALGIEVGKLSGHTEPSDKDRGLDVAAFLDLSPGLEGTVVFLTQCATGKNWREKRGEPSIDDWLTVVDWRARLVKAVALPWRLEGKWTHFRVFRHFEAIVLDRPRLLRGNPDAHIAEPTRTEVVNWCKARLAQLPSAA